MIDRFDVVIVGAGPAGMSCAVRLRRVGRRVLVIDEQPAPGGQIWRNVEAAGSTPLGPILGSDYLLGMEEVASFRASGAEYWSRTEVWKIEPGWVVHCRDANQTQAVKAEQLVIACGAFERVVPFPGWTLPGVLTVGAAQILLKSSGQVPKDPVWILGSGPLQLLYARQLLAAKGTIAGILDTTASAYRSVAWRHLPGALRNWRDLAKGVGWIRELKRAGVRIMHDVRHVELRGTGRVEEIRYRCKGGPEVASPASIVLVHDGVLPNLHMPASLGARYDWQKGTRAFAPKTDSYGRSSIDGLYIAGDAAGIGGAQAATLSGQVTAEAINASFDGRTNPDLSPSLRKLIGKRSRALALRPFLDSLFRPGMDVTAIADDTIVCRCEEITAGQIRAASKDAGDPDTVKTRTRAGMGMCQGRQCGHTLTELLAGQTGRACADLGLISVRPPLRPITLGELAALGTNQGGHQ